MSSTDQERALLLEGIDHFNEGRFWEAHESWETLWLESSQPEKTFLQGLIQLTAAFHHFQRGTLSGGVRLVDSAVVKLRDFPGNYLDVDRGRAVEAGLQARGEAAARLAGNRGEEPLPAEYLSDLRLRPNQRRA